MRRILCGLIIFILIITATSTLFLPASSITSISGTSSCSEEFPMPDQQEKTKILENFNRIGGFFTENQGQVGNDAVRYYIQGKGVWFMDDGLVFEIREERQVDNHESEYLPNSKGQIIEEIKPVKSVVLKLNFEGCKKVTPLGGELLPHRSNFFYGNDSSKWCTKVPNYRDIIYKNIYDDIDLFYYYTAEGLKYDFIVHPGGDPEDIKLNCDGTDDLYIDPNGNLVLHTSLGDIVDSGLLIYQNQDNLKIDGKFKLMDYNTYGFELLTEYDRDQKLIIDPLVYCTYIGSSGWEYGYGIDVDSSGNAYLTGCTDNSGFPTAPSPGAYDEIHNLWQDVFIFKLNQAGTAPIYSTYIGGTKSEQGKDIIIDDSGNAYVVGNTNSADFPTVNAYDSSLNGGNDVFVVKLDPAGNGISDLEYSTYLGGTNYDNGLSIAIDPSNKVYVTGETQDYNFPNTTGAYNQNFNGGVYDVFVTKLDPMVSGSGGLLYSTFLGGTSYEKGYGIAVDSANDIYVTGFTYSTDFSTKPGSFRTFNTGNSDAFITKLTPVGGGTNDMVYSTYVGGSQYDEARDIDVDSSGNAYITGRTDSTNFPTTIGAYDTSFNQLGDIFVFKLNPSGTTSVYSTFIGNTNDEAGESIIVDSFNNAYVTGSTASTNFPTTSATAHDNTHNGPPTGGYDTVVVKFSTDGSSLVYSTFFGGSGNDFGYGLTVDSNHRMYITGYTTDSTTFPTTANAFQSSYNGGSADAYAFKLEFNNLPLALDINTSSNKVYRTHVNPIYIYSNGTDIEDTEIDLDPIFEYRSSKLVGWQNTLLTAPAYVNNIWRTTIKFDKTALPGYYDFQVKYNDTGGLFSGWLTGTRLLEVLNNLPSHIDEKISKTKTKQNEVVSIFANGTDIEDIEKNLTVRVEYRDPSETSWNIAYMDPIKKYIGDKWMINFTAPNSAPYGFYDFRLNITDTDGGYTGWTYKYDWLEIYNEDPVFVDVGLSWHTIYRDEYTYLYSNCTDFETDEEDLVYHAEYRHKTDTGWTALPGTYSTDRWQSQFTTDINSTLGQYSFRVKFEDAENITTEWQELETPLEVMNNLPFISYALDDIEVGRSTLNVYLTEYEYDLEDSDSDLVWSIDESATYYYLESVKIIDEENDILEIVPKGDAEGEDDIELTLTDKDGGTDVRNNITVHIDSTITIYTPKVNLVAPLDGDRKNIKRPKLEWELEYEGEEVVTYKVYLDENPEPVTLIKEGLTALSYKLDFDLKNNKTYYWKVIPSDPILEGLCINGPYSFSIDLGFVVAYRLSLTSERSFIPLKQGESASVNLTVTNLGNAADNFKFEFSALRIHTELSFNKSNIQLEDGQSGKVALRINLKPNFDVGEYIIFIKATSSGNESQTEEINITVKVRSRFIIDNFGVDLEVNPSSIELQQGKSMNVALWVENTGNVEDEYELTAKSATFLADAFQFDTIQVFVSPGLTGKVNVTIMVPDDAEVTVHIILFKANSFETLDQAELTIDVKKKSDTPGGGDEPTDKGEDDSMLYMGIIIAVVIIVVVLVMIFLYIHNKKKETDYLRELEEEGEDERVDIPEEKPPKPKTPAAAPKSLPMATPMKLDTGEAKPPEVKVQPTPSVEPQPQPTPTPVPTPVPTPTPTPSMATPVVQPTTPQVAQKVEK